jgi:hypothetical protein
MSRNVPIVDARPDHEETYDEWFIRQVEEALIEADDPNAVWVSHEEVMAEAAARREELMALIKTNEGK